MTNFVATISGKPVSVREFMDNRIALIEWSRDIQGQVAELDMPSFAALLANVAGLHEHILRVIADAERAGSRYAISAAFKDISPVCEAANRLMADVETIMDSYIKDMAEPPITDSAKQIASDAIAKAMRR